MSLSQINSRPAGHKPAGFLSVLVPVEMLQGGYNASEVGTVILTRRRCVA